MLQYSLLLTILLIGDLAPFLSEARAQTLTLADRQSSRTYTAQDLLADPATRSVEIDDIVYHRTMTYHVIPAADLLKRLRVGDDDYVQARATDSFSVAIPARLLKSATAGNEAFVAIEDPAERWPQLPNRKDSAGPFYVVWRLSGAAQISSEYWAYHLAALAVTNSPYKRWPRLGVEASVSAADPIRRGLDRFVAICMACHRFNGEGEGTQGPDLGSPMNPIDYFQPAALRKLLRNPASVRHWPGQKMPPFTPDVLPDSDIDAIVAWLGYKAKEQQRR